MKTISDKSTRKEAIPFIAYSWQGSGTDGFVFVPYDSSTIISEDETLAVIRCATPYGSNLVEAHLNLQINCVNPLGVKVAIGYFDTDDVTSIKTYSDTYIDTQNEFLTGSSGYVASSGGVLFIDGLNVYPKIPKRGEANFNENGFVLLLKFDRLRVFDDDELKKFEVSCSALLGLI